MSLIRFRTIVLVLATLAAGTAHAQVSSIDPSLQLSPPGQSARENARGGAVAALAPGNLVVTGVAQALQAADIARAGVDIVATERPTSIGDQLLAETIRIVFDQLNQAIVLFENVLRARAGRQLVIPGGIIPGLDDEGLQDLADQAGSAS